MASSSCKQHPDIPAKWICVSCKQFFCDACISAQRFRSSSSLQSCKLCGGMCKPVDWEEKEKEKEEQTKIRKSFFTQLSRAFSYPLQSGGIFLLVIGAIFFGILDFLGSLPFGWLYGALGSTYFVAYMFKIVNCSALGKEELPDWPEFTNFSDEIFSPLKDVSIVVLVSYSPAIIPGVINYYFPSSFLFPFILIGAVLGSLYFPMALLSSAVGTHLYIHPSIISDAIITNFKPYFVSLLVFGGIICINLILDSMVAMIPGFALMLIARILLSGVISFYFAIVEMRILGLIFYTRQEELEWF